MSDKRNKEVLIIIVSVIIIVIVAYLFISPAISSLKETNYDLKVKKNDLSRAQEHLDNLKTLETTFKSKKNEVEDILKALPTYSDSEDLIVTMETVANQNGMQVTSVAPQQADIFGYEEEADFGENTGSGLAMQEFIVDVGLKGSYQNLEKVLESFEKNRRPININTISIGGGGETYDPNALSITLSLTTYYLAT